MMYLIVSILMQILFTIYNYYKKFVCFIKEISNKVEKIRVVSKLTDRIKDEITEIHSKAYYNAIKKVEHDNLLEMKSKADVENEVKDRNEDCKKFSKIEMFIYLLYFLFAPKKAKEKFGLRDNLTEVVLRFTMASLLFFIGLFQKCVAVLLPVTYLIKNIEAFEVYFFLISIVWGIILGYLGSISILMSDEMFLEKNENRVQGLFTLFMSIISFIITIFPILMEC